MAFDPFPKSTCAWLDLLNDYTSHEWWEKAILLCMDRYTIKNQGATEDRATQKCAKKHAKLIREKSQKGSMPFMRKIIRR
jgi:hypothetical protein